jgi:hypothetical protein
MTTCFEVKECFVAFRDATAFPSGVFGPVLCFAFARLVTTRQLGVFISAILLSQIKKQADPGWGLTGILPALDKGYNSLCSFQVRWLECVLRIKEK